MDANSDNQKSSDQQFTGDAKVEQKKQSKSKEKKAGKGKGGKKPKDKEKKQGKQIKKKKPSKSKQKGGNIEKDLQTVKQYLEKQNRPYNLLNIFDNLHGSIKKPSLEIILDKLVENEVLTCKEFGKNKVYFLNQSKFQINEEVIQKLNVDLTEARQQNSELQSRHKILTDEYKKLMSMKTEKQIKEAIETTEKQIKRLEAKQQKLLNGVQKKVDEQTVIKAEKEQLQLRKQLKRYRGLTRDCIKTWAQILQKKTNEVADIMGIEL